MPQVVVPPPYRGPTAGQDRLSVEGGTVRECLEDAGRSFPGFTDQIFDGAGQIHGFVTLFLNGEELGRDELDRPVAPADRVEILAAIAGGACGPPPRSRSVMLGHSVRRRRMEVPHEWTDR